MVSGKFGYLTPSLTLELPSLLEGLKTTMDGQLLYDYISRAATEHNRLSQTVERSLVSFIDSVLRHYANATDADPATRRHAIAIRRRIAADRHRRERLSAPAGEPDHASAATSAGPTSVEAADDDGSEAVQSGDQSNALVDRLREIAFTSKATDRLVGGDVPQKSGDTSAGQMMEQNLIDAIIHNLDSVAHVRTVQQALTAMDRPEELEKFRHILIDTAEELVQGNLVVDACLKRARSYLKEIQTGAESCMHASQTSVSLDMATPAGYLVDAAAFTRQLRAEISRAQRYAHPLALALIDLDRLAETEETSNEEAATEVRNCYAAEVLTCFRAYDVVARYGESDFVILMPDTGQGQAITALHKARARADRTLFPYQGKVQRVPAFTSGLTWYTSGDSPASLIARADAALRKVRRVGHSFIGVARPPIVPLTDTPARYAR